MKDTFQILTERIFQLLNGNISAPVYNGYAPPTINTNAYVVISDISDTDISTKIHSRSTTLFQLSIFSKDTQANPGVLINTIASEILAIIYPTTISKIDLSPELQNFFIEKAGDYRQTMTTNNAVFVNRFLQFRAFISHND